MPIRIPKKNEKFPEPEPSSNSSNPTSDSGLESMFTKLTAKLRWEREHIEPELGELMPCYSDICYIFLTPQCNEGYVGEGYGFYRDCLEKYDEIGRRLAKLWPIDKETEERKVNHYSRGCK